MYDRGTFFESFSENAQFSLQLNVAKGRHDLISALGPETEEPIKFAKNKKKNSL